MKVSESSSSASSSNSNRSTKTESSSATSSASAKSTTANSETTTNQPAGDGFTASSELAQEQDAPASSNLPDLTSMFGGDFDQCDFAQGQMEQSRQGIETYMGQSPQDYQQALDQAGVTMGSGVGAQPGTLFVDDSFVVMDSKDLSSPDTTGHGYTVAAAARDQGFEGPIVGSNSFPNIMATNITGQAKDLLQTPGQTQENSLMALDFLVSNRASGLLGQKSQVLDSLNCDGVKQSVANFSQGETPANIVEDLYADMQPVLSGQPSSDPQQAAAQQALVDNLSTAFSVNQEALTSADSAVKQEAQQQLVQGLIDRVSQTFNSDPMIATQQQNYQRAVAEFEANNNSVVVSSGNQGLVAQQLINDIGPLQFPSNFTSNVLNTGEATGVGAADGTGANASEAVYSNPAEVYAPGNVNLGGVEMLGTSFAAPRYAATLAGVHGQNPGFSSDQATATVNGQMTHTLPTQDGAAPTLDFSTVYSYLQTVTK